MNSREFAEQCLTLRQVYDRIGAFLDQHPEAASFPTVLVAHDEHILPTGDPDLIGLSYVDDNDGDGWMVLTHLKYSVEVNDNPPVFATLGWETFDKALGAED